MTNTEIIYNAAIAHGIPQEQLDACLQSPDNQTLGELVFSPLTL